MSRGPILQEIWDKLPDERKQRILAQTDEMRAEYLTLQEVRNRAGLTQVNVSQTLGMPQSNVSRLEHSSDMLLSTLRSYVEAVGGHLHLVVELPGEPAIFLDKLSDLLEHPEEIGSSVKGVTAKAHNPLGVG